MRRVSLVVIGLTALLSLGCENVQPTSQATEQVCTPRPVSVSLVNSWPLIDAESYATDQERACASMVYYEMFPWAVRTAECDEAHPTFCTNAYRHERRLHLKAMSAHKIKTVWSPENFNAYGPKQWTDFQFRDFIRDFKEDAEDVGLEWVMMSIGGEPWAWNYDSARTRAEIVRAEWPGLLVMADAGANEATGRPYFEGLQYDLLEVHPCSIEQTYRSLRHSGNILTVTDCGPVLVPEQPTRSDLELEAVRSGVPLLFYGFQLDSLS